MKICATFPDVFNLDYFLEGKGSLLLSDHDSQPTPMNVVTPTLECSMQFEYQAEGFKIAIKKLEDQVKGLQADKERLIAENERLIAKNDRLLDILSNHLNIPISDIDFERLPFGVGIAESGVNENRHLV